MICTNELVSDLNSLKSAIVDSEDIFNSIKEKLEKEQMAFCLSATYLFLKEILNFTIDKYSIMKTKDNVENVDGDISGNSF